MLNYVPRWWSSRIGPGPVGHNFERRPLKDHCNQVWLELANYFQSRTSFNVIPYGPMLNSVPRWRPSWIGPGPVGHNSERGPPKDNCDQVWF